MSDKWRGHLCGAAGYVGQRLELLATSEERPTLDDTHSIQASFSQRFRAVGGEDSSSLGAVNRDSVVGRADRLVLIAPRLGPGTVAIPAAASTPSAGRLLTSTGW
jgi:hypothetical protein